MLQTKQNGEWRFVAADGEEGCKLLRHKPTEEGSKRLSRILSVRRAHKMGYAHEGCSIEIREKGGRRGLAELAHPPLVEWGFQVPGIEGGGIEVLGYLGEDL